MIPNKKILTAILWWCSFVLLAQAGTIQLTTPSKTELARADAQLENQRFAAPIPLDLTPAEAGSWLSHNGINGIWQLTVEVPNALGLALYLDQIDLPAGAELSLKNSVGTHGPFRARDVSALGRLFTGFLPGNSVQLLYRGTVFADDDLPFHIWRADFAYRADLFSPQSQLALNFGGSNDCQVNANCPTGAGWEDEKSAVARVIAVAEEGAFYCSGSLVNNTAEDGRPLFLTAYHCQENVVALYDLWRFDFGYTSVDCSDPVNEPLFTAYNGSLFRAGREASDFLLLEIVDPDFDATTHYFNGWDRTDGNVAEVAFGFHHPVGDIQKLITSTFTGLNVFANSISWENIVTPANHHLRLVASEGTAEIGSSGSPIFDANQRIRGQLHGGNISCPGSTVLFYGRIFQSWTGEGSIDNRLSDWLDPLGIEPDFLDGATLMGNGLGRILRGNVHWNEQPVEGARLIFNWGSTIDTVFSDAAGNYQVARPLAAGSVNISTFYDFGNELAGVNVTDIIALRRHILGLEFLNDRKLVAADVNNTGTETVGDIVRISQVILAITDWQDRPNWLVYPSLLDISGLPANIFGPFDITIPNPDAGIITLDFEVSKNGDVNDNVFD